MEAHDYNPCTRESEAGGLGFQGQPGLHSEFLDSLGYLTDPVSKIIIIK
jgi:hypothetical protein